MLAQVEVDGDTELCFDVAKALIFNRNPSSIKRVTIDRHEGLTLFMDNDRPVLHCTGLVCGYGGIGPNGSIQVVRLAGFTGDHTELIQTNPYVELSK